MKAHASAPGPLPDFLAQLMPQASRSTLKQMLSSGRVSVNGQAVTHHATVLAAGDLVEIGPAGLATSSRGGPVVRKGGAGAPFTILYQDEDMVAVDKPVGINTNSDDGSASVYRRLRDWYRDASRGGDGLWMVHRLDKEVSGVLVFARSEAARAWMIDHWREGTKIYHGLVEGCPEPRAGRVHSWLMENKAQKMYSLDIVMGPDGQPAPGSVIPEEAREAITHYRVVRSQGRHSLLEIQLETGRKNQIRVHMADLGCPLVGDRKYGSTDHQSRVMLHASRLSLVRPANKGELTIVSPLPAGFPPLGAEAIDGQESSDAGVADRPRAADRPPRRHPDKKR